MSEVTLEQLLALLEEERVKEPLTQEESSLLANHGERFLVDVDAKQGTYLNGFRSRNILIFWRYLKWCIEHGERPLSRRAFFRQVGKYYKSKPVKLGRYDSKERVYPILPDPFVIPPEEIRAAEMVLRDEMEVEKKVVKWKKSIKAKGTDKNSPDSKKTNSRKSNKNTTT